MMIIVLVHLLVQLGDVSNFLADLSRRTYQIKHRDFHHTLIEIGGPVLDNLYSDHLLCFQILAFHDLPKRTLPKHVKNEISIFVT